MFDRKNRMSCGDIGRKDVRANVILPGATDTLANPVNAPGATPETRSFIEGLLALKRLAAPEEIARTALHLASDAASFITGVALLVDGGVSVTSNLMWVTCASKSPFAVTAWLPRFCLILGGERSAVLAKVARLARAARRAQPLPDKEFR